MAFSHFIFSVIAAPECSIDSECGFTEKCQSGTCIPACKLISCGRNAQCTAQAHNARCECLPGYQGDPYSQCGKGMLISALLILIYFDIMKYFVDVVQPPDVLVGCRGDRDCPDYTACENRKCINPCAERDPCARNANCRVIMHQPVCTCPDGYIGDPRTSCSLRKYQIHETNKIRLWGNLCKQNIYLGKMARDFTICTNNFVFLNLKSKLAVGEKMFA